MKLHITTGNSKVKAIIFDLPAIKTCKGNLECHSYCYARKAERQYKAVLPARQRNLDASKEATFIDNMVTALGKKRGDTVRLHSSGDFYSVKYIKAWYEIMRRTPSKTFYAYTKRDDLFSKALLRDRPDNFTLIKSLDGIQEKVNKTSLDGFDKIAIVVPKDSKFANCKAQLNSEVKCGTSCRLCIDSKCKAIVFKKH